MDGLDEFSRSFANALFAAIPEFREHARAENGLLQISLYPGSERRDCEFWICTDGGEVTVGFGMFHTHFEWPIPDSWPERDPIRFILSVMRDETLIEDRTRDGEWAGSTLTATEALDLERVKPGDDVFIRSWSGAHDRTISRR